MPTLQKYTQQSNDANNRADKLLISDFSPEDIPTRVSDDRSSSEASEAVTLHLAIKRTHSVTANTAFTSYSIGCDSLQSSAGGDPCVITAHAGFETTASSQIKGQLMLDGHQLNDDGIEPVGLEAILSFGPSKVAKIKASAGVSMPCESGVQVTSPTISAIQTPFTVSGAAHNSRWKAAA